MKNALIALFALLSAPGLWAGADNVSIVFSTRGPDTYRDGRKVLDGEYYGLFWTPDGSSFAGIDIGGQAVPPSKLALKAAVAKGGRCPNVLFEIDADYARTNYPGGVWTVCLLDTRRFETDGDGVVRLGDDGLPVVAGCGGDSPVVNGYGEVGSPVVGSVGSADADVVARVQSSSVLPPGGLDVRVREIKVVDGNVHLAVEGTSPALLYSLKTGGSPSDLSPSGQLRYGTGGADLLIVAPVKEEGEFFSVGAKR